MSKRQSMDGTQSVPKDGADHPMGFYRRLIELINEQGRSLEISSRKDLGEQDDLSQLLRGEGLRNLISTMVAQAPARSGDPDEEWNPLSQRPHIPLLPEVSPDELGAEVIVLKESLDGLATFVHEMMHVALWEPFFAGFWKPQNQAQFKEFSLLAEGFCFFYTDIVVCGAVRSRFADGEFAFDRSSPGQARFHPIRAFKALGIVDHEVILKIYLDGFSGSSTPLWQSKGKSAFAASLAKQAFDFYQGSLGYLKELYGALRVFGCFGEFYRDFCPFGSLPTFVDSTSLGILTGGDIKGYFLSFFQRTLKYLHQLGPAELHRIRLRRMLQMRAYYASQVQWILKNKKIILPHNHDTPPVARAVESVHPKDHQRLLNSIVSYRGKLKKIITLLSGDSLNDARVSEILSLLGPIDQEYDKNVRRFFRKNNLWVGCRRLIAPKRAGGWIDACPQRSSYRSRSRSETHHLSEVILFLLESSLDSLSALRSQPLKWRRLETILETTYRLKKMQSQKKSRSLSTHDQDWMKALSQQDILPLWSIPLWSFDPVANEYRELLFSYQ